MTETLDALAEAESLLTIYLQDPQAGLDMLWEVRDPLKARYLLGALLGFIMGHYQYLLVNNDKTMQELLDDIHIGFLELRQQAGDLG